MAARLMTRRDIVAWGGASVVLSQLAVRAALAADPALANRDAANLAAGRRRRAQSPLYQKLGPGIVHFFGYGQSLSQGWLGCPVLSASQPYDNLMIGGATYAVSNTFRPPSTTWVPVGAPAANGAYPFNPMIASVESPQSKYVHGVLQSCGEAPGHGALNFFRAAFLKSLGVSAYPGTRFVYTECGIGAQTIAALSKGAKVDYYNRLLQAASYVRQSAQAAGLAYQVGGVIWTQGEQDTLFGTPASTYLASLQQLQADFAADVVQGIGGAPVGTTVPWFCHQPDASGGRGPRVFGPYQALAEWATTPGSDLYLAGPVYQYPNWDVHLTANSYRWHGQQVGKAMAAVFLGGATWLPLYVTGATVSGTTVTVDLSVPAPPVFLAEALNLFAEAHYPALGFEVYDSAGQVPVTGATIVGAATVELVLGRALGSSPYLQTGANQGGVDIGTNICDSDQTIANSAYTYSAGVQLPEEDITTWNGRPLVGQPYPLNNYLAINQVPITAG